MLSPMRLVSLDALNPFPELHFYALKKLGEWLAPPCRSVRFLFDVSPHLVNGLAATVGLQININLCIVGQNIRR